MNGDCRTVGATRDAAAGWHPSLYRHWYAVARADHLRTRPLAVTVLDKPVVLARVGDGSLLALEDRCPHRGAPLSAGCVRAGGIVCPYHGWRFAADGALQEMPGLPPAEPLPGMRVPAYPLRELDGLLWLRPSVAGDADPAPLVRALVPAQRRYVWQSRWPAHVIDAIENFLDALHTHSLHPGLVRRGAPTAPTRVLFRGTDQGFEVDYLSPKQSGWIYRLFESERTLERAIFAAPGSTQIEYRWKRGGVARFTLHFSPRDAGSTEVFATLHVDGRWAPAWLVRLTLAPMLKRVGAQDMQMLQLQSDNLRRFPGRRHAITALDVVRPALEKFWSGQGLPGTDFDRELEMLL